MADEYGPFQDATQPDDEWTLRGCVIRLEPGTVTPDGSFTSGGPYIHTNSGHIAVGVQSVAVTDGGDLAVSLDGAAITAILATPDETLTQRGIWCGPSGAAGNTVLRFYQVGTGRLRLNEQADWDAVSATLANVWVAWLTCTTRGTGQPSKADRALAATAGLEAATTALADRVAVLEALHIPGSIGRWDQAKAGQTVADVNAEHVGDEFADFNDAYGSV